MYKKLILPPVEEIIKDVVGERSSRHDIAVTAGINQCYRAIERHLQANETNCEHELALFHGEGCLHCDHIEYRNFD